MLPEPFRSLVKCYLENGGQVLPVPFGVSGKVYGFRELSAVYGMRGWVERFGIRHVPAESLPFIMSGELSVPAARAGMVWHLVEDQAGRATIGKLMRVLQLSQACVEATLDLLERRGVVQRDGGWPARFTAQGSLPSWEDFIRNEKKRAA